MSQGTIDFCSRDQRSESAVAATEICDPRGQRSRASMSRRRFRRHEIRVVQVGCFICSNFVHLPERLAW